MHRLTVHWSTVIAGVAQTVLQWWSTLKQSEELMHGVSLSVYVFVDPSNVLQRQASKPDWMLSKSLDEMEQKVGSVISSTASNWPLVSTQ
tara:strand:+ start:231 stop:500 length:270 start_codon:yes stop_codon:yes gene_type:complete